MSPATDPAPKPKTGEPLLTLEEVAEFLAVPVRTLRTWRYRGEGPPALKIGGHVRYDPAALRRWLDAISKKAS